MSKVQTKVWALVRDRIGYQIYRQSVTNPRFYYDPHNVRWSKENVGEILAEYNNEDTAFSCKQLVEAEEKITRSAMLTALGEYNIQKTMLEDHLRYIVKNCGGYIV